MYLGRFPGEYHSLAGQSTNELWVNQYQNPFNQNVLFPAAKLGDTDPAAAYAMLAPAFAKIQADAIAFVNQFPAGSMRSSAQATVDGWKAKDWPLIQGFLNRWGTSTPAAVVASPAGTSQPTTGFQDSAPLVFSGPLVNAPGLIPAGSGFAPASNPIVNVSTGAPAGDIGSQLSEYLPWVAGAAVLGLLLSRRRKSG